MLLLISLKPAASMTIRLAWLEQQNVKCPGWHFNGPSHFLENAWIRRSKKVPTRGQLRLKGSTCIDVFGDLEAALV